MKNLIKQSFRIDRFFIYNAFFIFGASIQQSNFDYININTFIGLFSFILLFMFQIVINDFNDKETDSFNHKNIFLNKKYKYLGIFYLSFGLLLAYIVGNIFFQFSLLILFVGILYSQKPFRLKRYFPISNILLGLYTGLSFFIAYFLTHSFDSLNIDIVSLFIMIILYFSIVSIIKDFKDFNGDFKENIYTLPVILFKYFGLSENQQKNIFNIMYFFLLSFISLYFSLSYLMITILMILYGLFIYTNEKYSIIILTLTGWIIFFNLFMSIK